MRHRFNDSAYRLSHEVVVVSFRTSLVAVVAMVSKIRWVIELIAENICPRFIFQVVFVMVFEVFFPFVAVAFVLLADVKSD